MTKNKVTIVSDKTEEISNMLKNMGFVLVKTNPDLVVSYGGDGTVMKSEAIYPSVPKLILKNSRVCKLCSSISNEEIIKKVLNDDYKINDFLKITVKSAKKELTALNDIIIHNADPRHAIRYKLIVSKRRQDKEIIGDGIVISTPLGSTGYYRSITDSFFELGIGIAFNNSTEQSDHMVIKEDSKIQIEITRGPAIVYADNQKDKISLKTGDIITITKSKHPAKIISVN